MRAGVWEYYPVSLSAGTATFQIDIANTTSKPNMAPLADRNIDAIMLTTNLTDIKMRALNEQGSTPLDGLHTQRDEVYMKVSTAAIAGSFRWRISTGTIWRNIIRTSAMIV